MTDYSKLDSMIIEKIKAGSRTFSQIESGGVYSEANRLHKLSGRQAIRIIDGRLQFLRKKGLIQYTTKEKWQVAK
ncbi:hypothetical protein [Serratia marcescens]|uniref:hypothetical protein n=1 Tax=Serratia marcescens TaxID=615 RepID=UPI0002B87B4F|nr:hypothetical protein [Serratia marcescens]EMF03318.1 hypothetical protein F518_22780 [Serratia marcescens VGH107]